MSLARAFKYAGCANILMSLWQADDQATAQIMRGFYQHLKQGLGKDEAIRRAKLDYLADRQPQSPVFLGRFCADRRRYAGANFDAVEYMAAVGPHPPGLVRRLVFFQGK
jgi:hypothetical protein